MPVVDCRATKRVCLCAGEPSFEFVCLLPLFDPPRHDTKETIDRCREKGISVKMVTGDQLLIGKETARQLGLGTDMYSTEVLLAVSPFVFQVLLPCIPWDRLRSSLRFCVTLQLQSFLVNSNVLCRVDSACR